MYRGRFAPSPTGDLHLGSAAAALVAWLSARAQGGRLVLRVEDLDAPRTVAGAAARQLADLRWLGLDWDEGPDVGGPHAPYRQSERTARYDAALADLARRGLVYWCDCSRAEIARAASAPHPGDEGPRYPGTCRSRGMRERTWKRPPALRLRVPDRVVTVADALHGPVTQHVADEVGDFVLARGDGVHAYQLAVVVDDLAMGVTEVVRGADLLASAPRQALLAELLGGSPPAFAHVPLVLAADGARLAKRARGATIRDLRAAGRSPADVVGLLARTLGLGEAGTGPLEARALLARFDRHALAGRREVRLDPLRPYGAERLGTR
ncbi:MAG TPA: tRNA glutamyl-Q(34) synthetase GluQRS [Candidatus Binatia bacterium]|nr:tRNA glutamyl-Q(34) synthetase GluQRS [Candidatus Binatia bacterium]